MASTNVYDMFIEYCEIERRKHHGITMLYLAKLSKEGSMSIDLKKTNKSI